MTPIELLKKATIVHGQRTAGKMIGKSASTVNMILQGTYPNPDKILAKVKEVFEELDTSEFSCPHLGEIHIDVCKRYKAFAKDGKIHKDRLYRQVKDKCNTCKMGEL